MERREKEKNGRQKTKVTAGVRNKSALKGHAYALS